MVSTTRKMSMNSKWILSYVNCRKIRRIPLKMTMLGDNGLCVNNNTLLLIMIHIEIKHNISLDIS